MQYFNEPHLKEIMHVELSQYQMISSQFLMTTDDYWY